MLFRSSLRTNEGTHKEVKMTYRYVLDLKDRIFETCKLAAEESGSAEKYKFYFDKQQNTELLNRMIRCYFYYLPILLNFYFLGKDRLK